MNSHITIDQKMCKGCLLCIASCPVKAITPGVYRNVKGYLVPAFNEQKCSGCMTCEYICPDMAITIEPERKVKAHA